MRTSGFFKGGSEVAPGSVDQVCFAWRDGHCSRGDTCKFAHKSQRDRHDRRYSDRDDRYERDYDRDRDYGTRTRNETLSLSLLSLFSLSLSLHSFDGWFLGYRYYDRYDRYERDRDYYRRDSHDRDRDRSRRDYYDDRRSYAR